MFFFFFLYIYIVSWICKQIRLFTMHRLCQSIVDNSQVMSECWYLCIWLVYLCQSIVDNAQVIYVFDIYIQCLCEDITIKAIKASLFMYLMSL